MLKNKIIQLNYRQYQICDIVMLSILSDNILKSDRKHLILEDNKIVNPFRNEKFELYFLSNNPKKGNWMYNEERKPSILQCIGKGSLRGWKKIIATTDSSLKDWDKIEKENLDAKLPTTPQIPQSFIEYYITEYNKGNVISKVLVEVEERLTEESIFTMMTQGMNLRDAKSEYNIKLNQNNEVSILGEDWTKQNLKQKTLEEAAERLFPINSTNGKMEMLSQHQLNNSLKQEGFIEGVKSDIARDYWFKIFKDKFIDISNGK